MQEVPGHANLHFPAFLGALKILPSPAAQSGSLCVRYTCCSISCLSWKTSVLPRKDFSLHRSPVGTPLSPGGCGGPVSSCLGRQVHPAQWMSLLKESFGLGPAMLVGSQLAPTFLVAFGCRDNQLPVWREIDSSLPALCSKGEKRHALALNNNR